MAPTPITKTVPTVDGVQDVAEVAINTVDGNTIAALSPKTIITVRNNDSGGAHSITFVTSFAAGGLQLADKTVSIPASATRRFSSFDPKYYGRTLLITGNSAELKIQAMES